MPKTQHVCFTLNNYTDDELHLCQTLIDHPKVLYFIFGRELAPSTGTPHLQCYLQLDGRKELSTIIRILHAHGLRRVANVIVCNGSSEENREYCSKDGEFEEFGEITAIQGKRRRGGDVFTDIRDRIKEGARLSEIACEFPREFIKHHTGIKAMKKELTNPIPKIYFGPFPFCFDHDWTLTQVIQGDTNIGKTQYAKTLFPNPFFIDHVDKLKSFDPLVHGGIIFDDMVFTHWPVQSQIHLTDIVDERTVHIRYGIVTIPAETKRVFTCNYGRFPFNDDPAIQRRVQVHSIPQVQYNIFQ